ncbi:MAG: DMT family transporter [Gordonia sp. (in: high G+C Gram-positive bacteria)]|uniref:DMT family transporter n=1 Tax=Gordonia sp. (in: high G+C Gram-positive bacteria) TaxID=84139 RepID=UPI0039E673A1
MTALAVVLALLASAMFAGAAVLQQRAAADVPDERPGALGFVGQLLRRRTWLAGIALDTLAFGVQAAALAVGSVVLVQPLLVTTLLFALPLEAWTHRRRLTVAEWTWSGVLVAALAVFVLLGRPTAGVTRPSAESWTVPAVVLVVVLAACVGGARLLRRGAGRSLVLAVAAGTVLGYSDPLTKTAMDELGHGVWRALSSWELWAMIVAVILGTFWQQLSYHAGSVQTSLPTVSVLEPVVAVTLGLTLYREHLHVDELGGVAVVASVVVMAVATVAIGRLGADTSLNEEAQAPVA